MAVQDLIDEYLFSRVPGAAVAITRAGEPILAACHGIADLEWQQPVTPTTVFRLASITKPFTALTTILLSEEGLLDLDTPISTYLPNPPKHATHVTVRHLLTHTSGIPNFVTQPGFLNGTARRDHTIAEVLALFSDLPLDFEPGTRWGYSNSGYRLLEMIATEVTGEPFPNVLRDRVLTPAGMPDTRILADADIIPQRAKGYEPTADGYRNTSYLSSTLPGAAGGLGSTLNDLLAFESAIHNNVFGDLERMWQPIRFPSGRTENFALGWSIGSYRGHRTVQHAGGIHGFSTFYLRLPDDGVSVIMLANLDGYRCTDTVRRLVDATLDLDATQPDFIQPSQQELDRRAGRFGDTLMEFTVTASPTGLTITHADHVYPMRAVDPATFVCTDDSDVSLRYFDDDTATLHNPLTWYTGYRS